MVITFPLILQLIQNRKRNMRLYVFIVIIMGIYSCTQKIEHNVIISETESGKIKRALLNELHNDNFLLDSWDSCYLSKRINTFDLNGQNYDAISCGCLIKYFPEPFINYNISVVRTPNGDLYVFGYNIYRKLIDLYYCLRDDDICFNNIEKINDYSEIKTFNKLIADIGGKNSLTSHQVLDLFNSIFKILEKSPYNASYYLFDGNIFSYKGLYEWMEQNNQSYISGNIETMAFNYEKDKFLIVQTIDNMGSFKLIYSKGSDFTISLLSHSNDIILIEALDNPPMEFDCNDFR